MVILRLAQGVTSHFRLRVGEWLCGAMLFAWGALVYAPAATFENSLAFDVMAQIGSEATWGSAVMTVGTLRLMALIINGTFAAFPYAAHARAVTAMLGCFVWLQVSLGFWESGVATTALAVYPFLLVFEIFNTASAWSDAVWLRRLQP